MRDNEKMTVKPGMEAEYERYVNRNQDGYGNCAVVAGASFAAALDLGLTPEQAHDAMMATEEGNELTGFLAGCLIQAIVQFHPRGEEVRVWWNTRFGVPPEKAKGGVVNPAIMTIGS